MCRLRKKGTIYFNLGVNSDTLHDFSRTKKGNTLLWLQFTLILQSFPKVSLKEKGFASVWEPNQDITIHSTNFPKVSAVFHLRKRNSLCIYFNFGVDFITLCEHFASVGELKIEDSQG